jgi:hypothetical protein
MLMHFGTPCKGGLDAMPAGGVAYLIFKYKNRKGYRFPEIPLC